MLEFSGILPVRITTSFPPVESFAFSVNEGQDNYEIPSNVPVLYNNGGYLSITFSTGWSTTEPLGPPGALWSNGYLVSVTPGSTPDPSAPPVFYGIIDAADLLALGGANLPLDDPFAINQLWNSGGLVVISSG